MKKKLWIFISTVGVTCILAAAIAPAIVYTQNSTTNDSEKSKNLSNTNTSSNNSTIMAKYFNDFNSSSTNYQTTIQSISPDSLMNALNQDNQKATLFVDSSMINKTPKKKDGLSTKEQKILVTDEKEVITEIDSGKLNVKKQVDNLQTNFYNNLSSADKLLLQHKISAKEYQIITSRKMQNSLNQNQVKNKTKNPNLFVLNLYSQNNYQNLNLSTIRNDQNQINTDANKIRDFAIVSSTAAAASTVLALAMLWIPFVGWFDEAFAVADTVIDWAAAGFAWKGYWSLYYDSQAVQNAITNHSKIADGLGAASIGWDSYLTINYLRKAENLSRNASTTITNLDDTVITDQATNDAGSFAEPEIDAWYSVAICGCSLILDIVSTSVGSACTLIAEDIASLQAND